jgi:cobalt-zinc-cadmium efflux system protein
MHVHDDPDHGHHHGPARYNRAFTIGVTLNLGFVVVEAVYGVLAHSLSLLADAGHNLSDVLGLLLAWGAVALSRRLPTKRYTYGLRRSSILAALFNAVLLLVAVGGIAWEAILRFASPQPVVEGTVIIVAAIGIVINGATALLFMSGSKGDLNIRGAFLHMAADAGVSLGVVLAGVAIGVTGWLWLDPATSLAIVVVIMAGTWGLLRDSVSLALDAVPGGIDLPAVQSYLEGLPGVTEAHDLHVWAMSTTEPALTAHLVLPGLTGDDALLARACKDLHETFGIEHATIQLEHGDQEHPCELAPGDVV